MAVYRSPFSKGPQSAPPPVDPYNIDYDKLEQRKKEIGASTGDLSKLLSGVVPGKQETNASEEASKQRRGYETAMVRILNSSMSEKEKKKQIDRLKLIHEAGRFEGPSLAGDIGRAVSAPIKGAGRVAKGLFQAGSAVSKSVQSGIQEQADALYLGLKKVGLEDNALVQSTIGAVAPVSAAAAFKKTDKPKAVSWTDFKTNYKDPDFKLIETGVGWADAVIDFGVDAALDPLSYLGAGAVNYAGKTGRIALATKFATKEMRAKYPMVDLQKVARFGAGGLPKAVRDAEGISYGVKFAGRAVRGTDKLADIVAGQRGVLSNARAATGDIIQRSKALKNVRGKVAPSSRAGLIASGFGRIGTQAASEDEIIKQVANYTSAKFGKGAKKLFYEDSLWKAKELVDAMDEAGYDRQQLTKLVEDPLARASAPPELRDFAQRIVDWQNELREGVNAIYNKFGLDYGARVNEIGFIDDYVHHKLTSEALEAISDERFIRRGWFKTADVTSTELGQTTGAAMYRKYRKDAEFMGEVLETGHIDEINEIFARKMKDMTGVEGLKFFDDDIVSVMDSYAYSMSAARGREAFIRRAMDFGGDIVQVINTKVIPDHELVQKLNGAYKLLVAARDDLEKQVMGFRRGAEKSAEAVIDRAGRVLDDKARGMTALDKRVDTATKRLAEAEMRLVDALSRAAELNAQQRGAFVETHQALLEDVQRLKRAIETDTVEEAMALEAIKDVYRKVFPNAKRIPDNPTKALNAIKRAKGIAEPEEMKELVRRRDAATAQIEELTESGVDDAEMMNELLDIEVKLSEQIEAFEVLGDVRLKADYAEDGLLYGRWDDLNPREFDPNVDPRPYRTLDTRPLMRVDGEMSTDEIAAMRNAFREDPNSVVAHAIDPDEMIDLREPDNWYGFFDNEGPIGDAMARALIAGGVDAAPFAGAWNDLIQGGNFDPMFEEIYPELAALIDQIGLTGAKTFPDGVVDDDYVVEVFDTIRLTLDDIADKAGAPDPERVGEAMYDAFIRNMANEAGDAPVLFPARVIHGARNNMADGAYSAVLPDGYGYAKSYNPDDLIGYPTAPVRFTQGDEVVQQVMDGSLEQASWDIAQEMESLTGKVAGLQERVAAKEVLEQEIRQAGRQIGARKGAATKRIKDAEKAFDDYAKTGTFEIQFKGGTKRVTREEALKIVTRDEAKILKEIAKLEENIAAKTGRSVGAAKERIREKQARLAALMDEKKVLQRWNDGTGEALRGEIEGAMEAIALDPPRGYAGRESRAWSERVGRRLENIKRLEGDVTPEYKAWSRLVQQMHGAEVQLSYLDMFEIPRQQQLLQAAKNAAFMGKVVDDVEEGWSIIQGLGVKMPPEVADIMMPNIRQLRDPKNRNMFTDILDFMNDTFKTYATLTPGFTVRNAISAAFMNTAAGATFQAQKQGAKAVRAYLKHGPMRIVDGQQVGWLKEMGLDPSEWDMYETALKAAMATSRGISADLAGPAVRGKFGEFVLNNKFVRGEAKINKVVPMGRKANDAVELSVRMPLALDTLQRGAGYDEAVSRITRYHFDYDDLSSLDEWAKRFIPFWIWTSRNIPLQVTEQLLRPQTYAQYDRLRERNQVGSEVVMPMWMSRMNPMPLKDSWMLAPDLPNLRLEEAAQNFADPKKLIGQMYPMFKLPVELAIADKQLAMDIPFTDKYEKARGLDALIAKLGAATGRDWLGREGEDGGLEINPRVSYAIGNLMPSIATAQRLTGGALGGKEQYADRQLQSLATFLGIPLRNPEPYQRGELIGRQFKTKDLMNELVRRGLVPKQD